MARLEWKRWMPLTAAVVIVGLGVVAILAMGLLKSNHLVWDRGKIGLPRMPNEAEIGTNDLPALVDALSRGTAPVRWAALLFNTPDRPSSDETVNLQVSSENGRTGFDWILLAPRNIADQEKFKAFARSQGFVADSKSLNGVSYLRVECPDAARFTESVVTRMYGLSPNEPLGLVYEGFDWPRNQAKPS